MSSFLLGVGKPLNYYLDNIPLGGSKVILSAARSGDVGQYTVYQFLDCQKDY